MKIIREKSTNEIIYKGDDLVLDEAIGLYGNDFRANNITVAEYELLDVDIASIPADYMGRHYTYNDGVWTATETKARYDYEQYKSSIPARVTMRQARLALLQAGLLDDIELAINNLEEPTLKRAVQIEWEYAQDIRRDWQALIMITEAMGMTEEQLDELFIAASKL